MGIISEIECQNCDERTEKNINTLLPNIQTIAKQFVDRVKTELGKDIVVASGLRTFAEQDRLYCKGRPNDSYCKKKGLPTAGKIVTKLKGGEGNHNFGKAFDVYLKKKDGQIDLKTPITQDIANIAKGMGLKWGGDWRNFKDLPHFELPA